MRTLGFHSHVGSHQIQFSKMREGQRKLNRLACQNPTYRHTSEAAGNISGTRLGEVIQNQRSRGCRGSSHNCDCSATANSASPLRVPISLREHNYQVKANSLWTRYGAGAKITLEETYEEAFLASLRHGSAPVDVWFGAEHG
jgi:hypothetical protein